MTQEQNETPDAHELDEVKTHQQKAEQELEEYKDKYLRLLAEMDNIRKKMQREKQEAIRFAVENALEDFLSPLDNLENALNSTKHMSKEVLNWAQGFQMITQQCKEALEKHGIKAFSSDGTMFDPNLHHALETEETEEIPEGTILQEFTKGYKSSYRTIRPAHVKVAVLPESKKKETIDLEKPSLPEQDT
ncbi:MAG TPA: nucleotide exchange factor GrpE [Candidatus Rhabdochlamydia sp.]|jgi:molecular chaperone GrpE|nr:nucleotide exchange factor GrpE [Candidatus Rhabdochlamydia sp.]